MQVSVIHDRLHTTHGTLEEGGGGDPPASKLAQIGKKSDTWLPLKDLAGGFKVCQASGMRFAFALFLESRTQLPSGGLWECCLGARLATL